MVKKQRRHTAACKFRVALEALEGSKTISQIASEHEIHANLNTGLETATAGRRAQRLRQQWRAQATGAGGAGSRTL